MIGNKNCVCHLFSRRFTDLKAEKSVLLCFKRFLKKIKKIYLQQVLLLYKGKLETEPDICIGSRESICHKWVIHGMIGKYLKVEPVA